MVELLLVASSAALVVTAAPVLGAWATRRLRERWMIRALGASIGVAPKRLLESESAYRERFRAVCRERREARRRKEQQRCRQTPRSAA